MSSTIGSQSKPSSYNTEVFPTAGSKVKKATALITTAAALEAIANAPAALATGCTPHTDVFKSQEGNRYAITSCSARQVKNVLEAFVSKCGAKASSYSAAAPFWHFTRDYKGSVQLGVEHYGVKDASFQQCMDDNNAGPIHAANIYDATIAGYTIAGIACVIVLVGLGYGAYRCGSACTGAARRGLENIRREPRQAEPQSEAHDLGAQPSREAPDAVSTMPV